jgi:AAA+ ATPase superfamily predicted ATPase
MNQHHAPDLLIDREVELMELRELFEDGRPHLALLTGRRRVGKTYLLVHGWKRDQLFLFTAARTTPEVNRLQLLSDLAAWSGEEIRPEDHPTWRTVFNRLLEVRPPDPIVVVLDEFQYLADQSEGVAGVASELNAAWERRRPMRSLLVVLSGSAMGVMESLAGGGGPLYGRFSWQRRLQPFNYWHAAELASFPEARDRALSFGILGGTPRYLAAVNATASLADNVIRLLLSPSGEVRLLVETALDQEEGLREPSKYRAVLRAVGGGCTERNEIAQRTGLANDAALRDKLSRLIELGYLETRRNIDARPNEPVRYAIADAAFRFHVRFVEPAASLLERYPPEEVWQSSVAPQLDTYMGHEFERIAAQAYDRRAQPMGLPLVKEWGRWEGVDRERQPLEIDLVAPLVDGRMLTGAVKWHRLPIGAGVHAHHIDMLRRAAAAGRAWAHKALKPDAPLFYVAAGGFSSAFTDAVAASGHPAICWTLEDLYTRHQDQDL